MFLAWSSCTECKLMRKNKSLKHTMSYILKTAAHNHKKAS